MGTLQIPGDGTYAGAAATAPVPFPECPPGTYQGSSGDCYPWRATRSSLSLRIVSLWQGCSSWTFFDTNRAAPVESRGGPINYSDAD